jgi:hypothetical protein
MSRGSLHYSFSPFGATESVSPWLHDN